MAKLRVALIGQSPSPLIGAVAESHRVVGLAGPEVRWRLGMARAAREIGASYHPIDDDYALGDWLRSVRADILVICGLPRLIAPAAFEAPKFGTINIHPSYLPEYRGPNPIYWLLHDDAPEGGVTIHFVDSREDHGGIIRQERFAIQRGMTVGEIWRHATAVVGRRLLLESLDAIAGGGPVATAQPDGRWRRGRRVTQQEHHDLVDWSWPIERVWHFLHGTDEQLSPVSSPSPWRRLVDWKVVCFERCRCTRPPGSLAWDPRGFYLSHAEGKIRLRVRPPPAKRLVSAVMARASKISQ